ncbi:6679_t:CDS:2 [Diversispora eburnea]|uniref:6679_t:CDS:1 n=1 Tax=Diversispora eburnea TaxID=1213867 RepID=A0A9N8V3W7_9GLOM|nr:6679_t:CDS:2 [Diversispora eburnea]
MTGKNEKVEAELTIDNNEVVKAVNEKPKGRLFNAAEMKNIAFYIGGIMCFKFAYETLSNSISLIAQERFPKGALTLASTLTSTFNVMQILFSIAGAQLLIHYNTNKILAFSMFCFGALALVLIILEAATGGYIGAADKWVPGTWAPELLFALYLPMGGCLGVVELVRRVIPRDIVGEDPIKLMKMDASVHIFYEIAGTAGAFSSTATIKKLGPVYALFVIPVFFTAAGITWLFIKITTNYDKLKLEDIDGIKVSRTGGIRKVFTTYFYSIKRGFIIITSERRFIWLIPGYVLPLMFHRYIEGYLFPTFSKQVLKEGHLSGFLLAASNFGELCGALLVLVIGSRIYSPLPWVRLDSMTLMVLWVFPYLRVTSSLGSIKWVGAVFPLMMVLSAGWAAGDVSLVAYVQSRLHSVNAANEEGTSPLGCVMALLYSSYVLGYLALSIPMGKLFDKYKADGNIIRAFFWGSGILIVIGAVIIFSSTFIPKGAFALNPKVDGVAALKMDQRAIADEVEHRNGQSSINRASINE